MRHHLVLIFLCAIVSPLAAQSPQFEHYSLNNNRQVLERRVVPNQASYYQLLTEEDLKTYLHAAPLESEFIKGVDTDYILEIPDPNGNLARFRIVRYEMMEKELAQRFPEIVNALGYDLDHPSRRIRLDWTYKGFHARVSGDPQGQWYVEPLYVGVKNRYQVYYTKDYPFNTGLNYSCGTEASILENLPKSKDSGPLKTGDCTFRGYRLAMATTGEYYDFHGTTDAEVLSEINTAISRVNDVTEQDLAIRMILIGNNDLLLFDDGATDPYDNNDGAAMLAQNQTTIDNTIGSANYDIGHVFSTGGGGIASLRSPCTSFKAQGVTGLANPSGDPFYIDFVAHELGHQFGGNHTFNSENGNCSQRAAAVAFEPGSGSTIQAYAGICGAVSNVQTNSDDYYHAASIIEMANYMTAGNGDSCDTPIGGVSNGEPTVMAGLDYTIPQSTPFVLTATGSDPNSDPLDYCWEQFDLGAANDNEPTGGESDGPIIRSLQPTSSPSRFIDGSISWEALPSVARDLNFVVTLRDTGNDFGCPVQDAMIVTVANTGPFEVTSPNGGESATANSAYTVTWDVGGTGSGTAVDCANVMIELSLDGGATYSTLLASTPNDGSQSVTMPDVAETDARIRITCTDNIFYDFSDADFSIVRQDYAITATNASATICEGTNTNNELTFDLTSLLGYSGSIAFSETNLPAGATIAYSSGDPTNLNSGNSPISVTITLGNLSGLSANTYNFSIVADDGTTIRSIDMTLIIAGGPSAVSLVSPADNAVIDPTVGNTFSWTADPNANQYKVRFTGGGFITTFTTSGTSINVAANQFDPAETYTWNVESINTNCSATGSFSGTRTFTTTSGSSLSATDSSMSICEGESTASYQVGFIDGPVTGPASLSVQSTTLPGSVVINFNPSTISSGNTFDVNISNLSGVATGTYTITVLATGTSGTETIDLTLIIEADEVSNVEPMNRDQVMIQGNGDGVASFSWDAVPGATKYLINITGFFPVDAGTNTSRVLNFSTVSDGTMVTFNIEAVLAGGNVFSCNKTFTFVTVLPVEWLSFSAKAEQTTSLLNWTVIQDGQGESYTIERQQAGSLRFEGIGMVADNRLTGEVSYTYSDKNVMPGQTYYYRLRQQDLDGTVDYSPIREVAFRGESGVSGTIRLVPNPSGDYTSIVLSNITSATDYQLFDTYGRLLQKGSLTGLETALDLSNLPAAVYQVVLLGPGFRQVQKLVRQ